MATPLQQTTQETCPECGRPAEGMDVKYSYLRTTELGTHGPAPLEDLPRTVAFDEKITRFADEDIIQVQPCGDTFPRRLHADWLTGVEERREVERLEAAKRKHDRGPEGLVERIEDVLPRSGTVNAADVRAAIDDWRNQP